MLDIKRVVAYCLLAHINDSDRGIPDLLGVFVPMAKRALASLCSSGVRHGQLRDLKDEFDRLYGLDAPYGLLVGLLNRMAAISSSGPGVPSLVAFADGAFKLGEYLFEELDETIAQQTSEISRVEERYHEFVAREGLKPSDQPSLFDFLDSHRTQLAGFFAARREFLCENDYTVPALFVESMKNDEQAFASLRRIYLGSLISSYLELDTSGAPATGVELVLDTSFLIALLDLSSVEAHHTCAMTMELGRRLGYSFTVLDITVEEAQSLIDRHADYVGYSPFYSLLAPTSVEAACVRRKLTRTDLQRIRASLRNSILNEYHAHIQPVEDRTKKKAEASDVYKRIVSRKSNPEGAPHDGIAAYYVQTKRGKPSSAFSEAKAWFVTSHDPHVDFALRRRDDGALFETIRAEHLLNVMWLAGPAARSLDLSGSGLTSLVAATIEKSLPSHTVLREFDANVQRFKPEELTPEDLALVAASNACRSADRLERLNAVARNSPEDFCAEIVEMAKAEKARRSKEQAQADQAITDLRDTIRTAEADARKQQETATARLAESRRRETETLVSLVRTKEASLAQVRATVAREGKLLCFLAVEIWGALAATAVWSICRYGWNSVEPVLAVLGTFVVPLVGFAAAKRFGHTLNPLVILGQFEAMRAKSLAVRAGVSEDEVAELNARLTRLEIEPVPPAAASVGDRKDAKQG